MSLVRSAKPLPAALSTVDAWKARLKAEPRHVVLADAYEYNLWCLDEDGVPTITEHPIHETTIDNFLYGSDDAYASAIVEVLRRRGHDPYQRLVDDAKAAGVPERAIPILQSCAYRIAESL